MVSEFKFESIQQLHEMKWKKDEKKLNELKQQIEKYGALDLSVGAVVSNTLQERSNEWFYDESMTTVSIHNTAVKIVKIRGDFDDHFVFNNTKMDN
ncbi:hypothetical protein C9374_009434 [Naegleria lovaniensis]|uniref:Uncharacterized protein n=1 Tax=Naegleria lovaniensis TaxID=51637 RepID=A0AA88KR21_NAELO|nr:uncharacterized protein C9374_009434 [Naegleria lovaniensis]KAG2392857.1 hypothetical protein C9374_009434 [Naegleria lovaniensis]